MKKQFIALSLLVSSLLIFSGCGHKTEEKASKKVAANKTIVKKSKELIDNDSLDLDKELVEDLEA